jgi:hypothetical protein
MIILNKIVKKIDKVPLSSPVSSLGCASARKFGLGQKNALFGLGTQITILFSVAQNRYFPGVFGVREQRFPTRGVFYFETETRGNSIVTLVFNDVDRRKR